MAKTEAIDERDPAVAALWAAHYSRLAGWCRALVGDEDIARDIASEAFVRLLSTWRTVAEPQGYLYVTALNLMRDRWRSNDRSARLVDRLGRQRPASDPAGGWLGDVVRALPDRLRAPLVLHYYADLSVDDVAQALGRPSGTVKRQLSEARELLAEALGEEES